MRDDGHAVAVDGARLRVVGVDEPATISAFSSEESTRTVVHGSAPAAAAGSSSGKTMGHPGLGRLGRPEASASAVGLGHRAP